MTSGVRVIGARKLDAALGALGKKVTARAVLKRSGKKLLQPTADAANSRAPDDPATPGGLNRSYVVSSKLNPRQASLRRDAIELGDETRSFAEVYAGTNDPAGVQQEFGNINHGPQPSLRPAWDETKNAIVPNAARVIWTEIAKTARRIAARKAKGR